MDTLKGKKIMVWTFMGNTRMYNALRDYGDRISQIGLFSFKVRATGEIYESGVSISSMLTYINRYPHINWLLTVANDGTNSIFRALRDNTNGAQDMFLSEIVRIMQKYPWCDGIDIDMEKGDGYSTHAESTAMFRNIYNTVKAYDPSKMMNICFGVTAAFVLLLLLFLFIRIIRPFEKISAYPTELAKGNLTAPLKDSKSKYFGKFLWGLDLLREKLESQRSAELALQKQNKTMVLSLSHDIKTPLGVIELYAKALEKGLYKDEQKKKEVAVGITEKCEDIRGYVDGIVKTSSEDFLNLEVNNGEFYLSALIDKIKAFYTDKLSLLKIDFAVDAFSDHILSGDLERSIEVLQNIIENAVKYGDGKRIRIAFSRENDCQLIHIRNSGCTLSENELPHIFDSFWRGSNTGSNSGSGLGLYICRTLMRKMNGDIFAEIQDEEMVVTTVFEIS